MSSNHTASQRRGIKLTVVGVIVSASLIIGLFVYAMTSTRNLDNGQLRQLGFFAFETPRQLPKFDAITDQGKPFGRLDFQGKWTLVFFGFTHCPDICPTSLALLKSFYQDLDDDVRDNTRVVLVTVDPARDTPEKLAEYLDFFHEDFVGLTGEFLEIHRLATGLNTPFTKVAQGDDYTVDHGGNIALLNHKGHFTGFYTSGFEPAKIERTYMAMRDRY